MNQKQKSTLKWRKFLCDAEIRIEHLLELIEAGEKPYSEIVYTVHNRTQEILIMGRHLYRNHSAPFQSGALNLVGTLLLQHITMNREPHTHEEAIELLTDIDNWLLIVNANLPVINFEEVH